MSPDRTEHDELRDRVATAADWLLQSVLWFGVMLSALGLVLLR